MRYCNKLHDLVDDLILSYADAQLLLLLTFGGVFYSTYQCSVSLYHCFVAFHMGLVGLATSILVLVLVRIAHQPYLSSLARVAILGACIYGMDTTTVMELEAREDGSPQNKVEAVQGWTPVDGQVDDFILLPAYCILEDFKVNPFHKSDR
ncbi:hypothetical protein N657DRAFT_228740 [Parathielavia appendiculata]|uniref:Uncharacterized protein n=1 Tax=Parathielavia appendiculata TaxID=2587402 RepID=A0AAN6U891_9PEZI|nr:hypothetical protein N657DRAFT_228740 [Parathielavia appendiculata]